MHARPRRRGRAFAEWSATPPGRRRELLNAAAALLRERAAEIAGTMTEEVGATFGWGMFNCDLAARHAGRGGGPDLRRHGEVIPSDVPGALAMGVRQPVGVVVGIAPWNAPVILATRSVATPLAYGNTVVLKALGEVPAHPRRRRARASTTPGFRRARSTSSPTRGGRRRRSSTR